MCLTKGEFYACIVLCLFEQAPVELNIHRKILSSHADNTNQMLELFPCMSKRNPFHSTQEDAGSGQ